MEEIQMDKRDYDFVAKLELLRAIDERIALLDHIEVEFDYLEEDVEKLTRQLLDLSDKVEAEVLEFLSSLVAEVQIYAQKACASL